MAQVRNIRIHQYLDDWLIRVQDRVLVHTNPPGLVSGLRTSFQLCKVPTWMGLRESSDQPQRGDRPWVPKSTPIC